MTAAQLIEAGITSSRDAASFRDPSGFVIHCGGHVYRAVDRRVLDTLSELARCGLLAALMEAGVLVGTRCVDDPEITAALRAHAPQAEGYLQHARVPLLSYPYEWSPTMLADAALCTLDLQARLLAEGFALKDATAYNVQFIQAQPVFIDVPSIERPRRRDIWHAFGQFHRMFTQPLLLHRRRGLSLRGYFLASLDGAAPEEASRAFGWVERMSPALLLDVTLPAWLARRAEGAQVGTRTGASRDRGNSAGQLWNLRRVRAKIARLARSAGDPAGWQAYTRTCNYSATATDAKIAAVRAHLQKTRPATVLDIGCNTGVYSLLAAETGARVLAIDSDVRCVDAVYRAARAQRVDVLPLCVDLANPSPAIGFRNRERVAFLERARCDCVLALAVLHHLHVSANLPLAAIRDQLADLTRRDLVLEFVPASDGMFQRLTRFRSEEYGDYTLDECVRVFERRFHLTRRVQLPESQRTLLFWRRREITA